MLSFTSLIDVAMCDVFLCLITALWKKKHMLMYVMYVGDELFSDTYKMTVVDDIFYEVEGKVGCECIV